MQPLAERMRPKSLDDYLGQTHLIGITSVLRKSLESGLIPSMIFWGPPGVGKTTLANIISHQLARPFYSLSAVHSGVKDVRETLDKAKRNQFFNSPNPILFIDEIHRFNKSQQDSLLGAVEKGIVTLIGATTENPSFEVIPALLSRCQVYILEPLNRNELENLANAAISKDEYLKDLQIEIIEYDALLRFSGGDARKLYNALELCIQQNDKEDLIKITNESVSNAIQNNLSRYDKSGEQHYDIISAFIKSIRGSDPNAALYYLARMIQGGEDPIFICRRLIISASEDIGLANPNALLLSTSCLDAVKNIGMPEGKIPLAQVTVYLANSPKSNSAYMGIQNALGIVKETGDLPVPLHLRNAPTELMKTLNYGKDYLYPHNHDGNFKLEEYLPSEISGKVIFSPGNNPQENGARARLKTLWKDKYGY